MAASGLKLLFDEHFSPHHAGFVHREARLCGFYHLRTLNWSGWADNKWIPLAAAGGFVIVSGDRNEQTRELTTADLKTMNARVILVKDFWNQMGRWEKARWLVNIAETLVEVGEGLTPGSVVLMDRYGKIKRL